MRSLVVILAKYRKTVGRKQYEYHPGLHPAIIDEQAWAKAQQARALRYDRPPTTKNGDRIYPLSKLVRCRECNSSLRGQAVRNDRCYHDTAHAYGRACEQVTLVKADHIEERLVQFFLDLRLPEGLRETVLHKLAGDQAPDTSQQERTRLGNQLARAKRLFMLGDMTENEYLHEKARIEAMRSKIEPVETVDLDEARKLLETLGSTLAKATALERQQLFREILQDVYVEHKKVVAIRPKPNYYNLLCMSPADPTGFGFP